MLGTRCVIPRPDGPLASYFSARSEPAACHFAAEPEPSGSLLHARQADAASRWQLYVKDLHGSWLQSRLLRNADAGAHEALILQLNHMRSGRQVNVNSLSNADAESPRAVDVDLVRATASPEAPITQKSDRAITRRRGCTD